jgi:hypothetical protein
MLTTVWYIGKSKAAPVQAMKIYRGNASIAPLILTLGTRWRWVVNFTPRPLYHLESAPIPIEQEPGWAPYPSLDVWVKKKIPYRCQDWKSGWSSPWPSHYTDYAIPAHCHISSDLSYFIPHSATYSAPHLNNKPLNKESTKQSSTIFPVSRL